MIEDGKVSGNLCKRGEEFALSEINDPHRTLTTTMKTSFKECPIVPVRTSKPIKKGLIKEAMKIVNNTCIDKRLGIGETAIENILDSGADIIVTADILKEK